MKGFLKYTTNVYNTDVLGMYLVSRSMYLLKNRHKFFLNCLELSVNGSKIAVSEKKKTFFFTNVHAVTHDSSTSLNTS